MFVIACDKCKTNTNQTVPVVGIKITYKIKYDHEKEKDVRGEIEKVELINPEEVKSGSSKFTESCHVCLPCKNEIEAQGLNSNYQKLTTGETDNGGKAKTRK